MRSALIATLANLLSATGMDELAVAARIYLALMITALVAAGSIFAVLLVGWTLQATIRFAIRELRTHGLRRA
jgi:hypothetical protein